eukprot:UN31787
MDFLVVVHNNRIPVVYNHCLCFDSHYRLVYRIHIFQRLYYLCNYFGTHRYHVYYDCHNDLCLDPTTTTTTTTSASSTTASATTSATASTTTPSSRTETFLQPFISLFLSIGIQRRS